MKGKFLKKPQVKAALITAAIVAGVVALSVFIRCNTELAIRCICCFFVGCAVISCVYLIYRTTLSVIINGEKGKDDEE